MIDSITVARIIEAARIEDVVGDYVNLKKRGVNMIGLCPFHDEKTPSFIVSPAKNICKCFGCGKGGTPVHFLMELEHLTYPEALRVLAKKYSIEIIEKEQTEEDLKRQNDRESLFALNQFARNYFERTLHESSEGAAVGLSYFKERGFRDDIIKKFHLGYCLDEFDAFSKEATKNGYKREFLEKSGLAFASNTSNNLIDRFRGRVMFPVHTISGKVVAFGGRVLKTTEKSAKYINSPESEIYHKSNELFGIYLAKNAIVKHKCCFLVEGYTDVISMHQAGIENVVASSGTSLTKEQIRLIHRFTDNLIVLFDGDAAGIKAALRGIGMLLEEGMNLSVVLLPNGEDPDSYARSHDAAEFISFINEHKEDFVHFATNLVAQDKLKELMPKNEMIKTILKWISLVPDLIQRAQYVKEISTILSLEEQLIHGEVNKFIVTNKAEKQELKETPKLTPNGDSTPPEEAPQESALITPKDNSFDQEELEILYFLVRYGERTLFMHVEHDEDKKPINSFPVSVGEYILQELHADNIDFKNPLHQQFLTLYLKAYEENGFVARTFFVNQPDPRVSLVAADLLTDKYTLSKLYTKEDENMSEKMREKKELEKAEWLLNSVVRVIFEFKNKVVITQIKEKMLELKVKSEQKADTIELMTIMRHIDQLQAIKNQLAKELGDRVITKIS